MINKLNEETELRFSIIDLNNVDLLSRQRTVFQDWQVIGAQFIVCKYTAWESVLKFTQKYIATNTLCHGLKPCFSSFDLL